MVLNAFNVNDLRIPCITFCCFQCARLPQKELILKIKAQRVIFYSLFSCLYMYQYKHFTVDQRERIMISFKAFSSSSECSFSTSLFSEKNPISPLYNTLGLHRVLHCCATAPYTCQIRISSGKVHYSEGLLVQEEPCYLLSHCKKWRKTKLLCLIYL